MPLIRTNSQNSFRPIPEDFAVKSKASHKNSDTSDPDPGKPPIYYSPAAGQDSVPAVHQDAAPLNRESTPLSLTREAGLKEMKNLLNDFHEDLGGVDKSGGGLSGGGVGGGGGGGGGGGYGSRSTSRCSLRSSSRNGSRPGSRHGSRHSSRHGSRHGSRVGSRRNSDDEEEEEEEEKEAEVTGSQRAHLLVASQQRLVYTLQGIRHQLTSVDEEVDRIRNDILNSRRFFNAMRGIHEQPRWGSQGGKRRYCGSGSSSPSAESSYSDEMDSLPRSESCCSFTSWRSESESELYGASSREGDETAASAKTNTSTGTSVSNNSNDNNNNASGSSSSSGSNNGNTNSLGGGDTGGEGARLHVSRGRYRQLGKNTQSPRV